ncbi:MAG: 5-formyltetrahydrofolate cyclo-ligase [Nitrososphaeraceae archaeon]
MSKIYSKEVIRKNILNLRNQLTENDKLIFSKLINEKVLKSKEFKDAKCIGIYYPIGSEVYTFDIIHESLKMNKKIGLPRVINSQSIKFYRIMEKSLDQVKLEKDKYGVMVNKNSNIELELIDLLITPGVAFDKHCNRIGYGKGYYDRYICTNNPTNKIGLAFEKQLVDHIPINENDKKLDIIVTETNKYYLEKNDK